MKQRPETYAVYPEIMAVLDELGLKHIDHESTDDTYDWLEPGFISVEVPNPYDKDNTMFVDFEDELTLTIGDWHDHFNFFDAKDRNSQREVKMLMDTIRDYVTGQKCFFRISSAKRWLITRMTDPEGTEIPADDFYKKYVDVEGFLREIETYGGKVEFAFWNPACNVTKEIKPTRRTLFSYSLNSAWGLSITYMYVTDEAEENVCCILYGEDDLPFCETIQKEVRLTIPQDAIDGITECIRNRPALFRIKNIPEDTVLDGFMSNFLFSDGEKDFKIVVNNIYCLDSPSCHNEAAKLLLDTFKEIRGILVKNGVDEKYLRLRKE